MSERMQLNANDYQELQMYGPTGITEDQYLQIVKAAESIKGAAFWEGRRAENATRLASREATRND